MGYYIFHSFRTQPKIYLTHPITTPVGYFGLKPLLNPKEISLQLQLGCKFVPHCFLFTSQEKKIPTWQVAMFSNTTFKANPKTSGQAQYHCAMMRYIYIYMCVCVCVCIYMGWSVQHPLYYDCFFIIRSETVPIIPN